MVYCLNFLTCLQDQTPLGVVYSGNRHVSGVRHAMSFLLFLQQNTSVVAEVVCMCVSFSLDHLSLPVVTYSLLRPLKYIPACQTASSLPGTHGCGYLAKLSC